MDVAKAHIVQRVQLLIDARLILEECECVLDGEIEHISNGKTAESHLQCLAIVSLPFAHVTRHIDIGKEMHLDFHETISFARLTTSTFHVEREATRTISANLRFRHFSEKLANRREESRICRRIGARSSTNRTLIDVDDLVDVFESDNAIVRTRYHSRAIEMTSERVVQNVFDQRRLSRT